MWGWVKANTLAAVIIVVLLMVALAGALDSYKHRGLLKQTEQTLKDERKAKIKELAEAKKAWVRILNASDAKLAPALREVKDLRRRLAASVPSAAPTTSGERVARWKALGYDVRVAPCR